MGYYTIIKNIFRTQYNSFILSNHNYANVEVEKQISKINLQRIILLNTPNTIYNPSHSILPIIKKVTVVRFTKIVNFNK